ncbi:basic secretory protein-like protein [Sphingobacterium oryzagri]|uniref:Basic secretory protein-like protein n=1 Tax=Sphingobacterium oryzagri TaxID=3025669 RepID=A0ABY7WQB4_9SPHI|nr:basic secretory protein-like protein [Sphingobacterium sp. KACC 22765]WDF70601.1 basic secretory protein-like protein [Sphingobacterium sp. KACC 22765]
MKKIWCSIALIGALHAAKAQDGWSRLDKDIQVAVAVDTLTEGKYSLVFIDKAAGFDQAVKQRLIDTFFETYPRLAKKYNKQATPKVVFVMDPDYDGIAAAGGGVIRFNPAWFKKNPGDIDIVTHEGMHLVQAYPGGAGPGWITEGIADYVRFVEGVDNAGAKWTLPELKPEHHYENAYRITARFFFWIETKVKKGTMVKLDKAMREKKYTETFWEQQTGKTLDALWDSYKTNPTI